MSTTIVIIALIVSALSAIGTIILAVGKGPAAPPKFARYRSDIAPQRYVVYRAIEGAEQILYSRRGISLTPLASQLVSTLLLSVYYESHRTFGTAFRNAVFEKWMTPDRLAGLLSEIAVEENVATVITTFDILHWLERNLSRLNPFPKEGRP